MSIRARLDQAIAQRGWAVIGTVHEGPPPRLMAYTVGATETLCCPELLVFGLPLEHATVILNAIQAKVKDAGLQQLADGTVLYDVATMPLAIKSVQLHAAAEYTLAVIARYGDEVPVYVQQVVLSDEDGRFPWNDRYDERDGRMRLIQPELWKK
jgi:hypothetical protein